MLYRNRTLLLLPLFLLVCAVVYAATEERTTNHSFSLNSGGTVELGNVNGDITIRAWDKNEVNMKVTKRGPEKYLDDVEIVIDATPERLSVETKYPRMKRDINVSVTYELMVPRQATLDSITTVNGGIEVANVEGRIDVNTVNGSAELIGTKSEVQANTVNGNITVQWNTFPDRGDVKMETVNGSLELELPADANADVHASSLNGSIRTDFPVTVRGTISRKLEGRIGSGGPRIHVTTVNGGIEIAKAK